MRKHLPIRPILLCAVMLGIAAFITYLNDLTPLFADDFSYSISFHTIKPIHSLAELFRSQYVHYFAMNGRSVVHTLAQALLWLGKPGLNVCNGLAFLGLCLLICVHASGSLSKIRAFQLLAVFAALWFLTPHFAGSYLWVMGAANYLYSPAIILLFLLPYRNALSPKQPTGEKARLPLAVLNLIWGILAGWSNENTSLALIVCVVLILLVKRLRKERCAPWMWTGLLGCLIGCAMLFLSPGQAKRLANAGGFGALSEWIRRFFSISKDVIQYLWLPILLWVAAVVLLAIQSRRAKEPGARSLFARLTPSLIYVVGAGVSIYSMVGSPEFPVWIWSSILAFCLCAVFSALRELRLPDKRALRIGAAGFACVLLAAIGLRFRSVAPELYRVRSEFKAREAVIASLPPGSSLTVRRITTDCTYSSYSLFWELGGDGSQWPNTSVAVYYGLSSIVAEAGE